MKAVSSGTYNVEVADAAPPISSLTGPPSAMHMKDLAVAGTVTDWLVALFVIRTGEPTSYCKFDVLYRPVG